MCYFPTHPLPAVCLTTGGITGELYGNCSRTRSQGLTGSDVTSQGERRAPSNPASSAGKEALCSSLPAPPRSPPTFRVRYGVLMSQLGWGLSYFLGLSLFLFHLCCWTNQEHSPRGRKLSIFLSLYLSLFLSPRPSLSPSLSFRFWHSFCLGNP